MTVPNIFTSVRILLTPVLVWFLLEEKLNQALTVFLIAGVTDGLDGFIARLFHQKSRLGACLDPLADKLLLVSSFVSLGFLGLIPLWLVLITVLRDFLIVLGVVSLMVFRVPVEIRPTVMSKLTTLFELVSVLLVLSSSIVPLDPSYYRVCYAITAGLCIVSGVQYAMIGLHLVRSASHIGEGSG